MKDTKLFILISSEDKEIIKAAAKLSDEDKGYGSYVVKHSLAAAKRDLMLTKRLTADYCREYANEKGITLRSVGSRGILSLHRILSKHVILSDCLQKSFRVDPVRKKDIDIKRNFAALYVSAFYFSGRDGITFSADGFIGFCGWADSINSQPIYHAFIEWCDTEVALRDGEK